MKYYAQYNHITGELSKANVKCLNKEVDNIEISKEVFNSFGNYIYDNGNIVLDTDYKHKKAEVRAVRNSYLEKYVDPKQLVMVWESLSADDKKLYADYRTYLLDYTEQEDWYLQNPMTLDEWKQSVG